jgi:hypothetical protein
MLTHLWIGHVHPTYGHLLHSEPTALINYGVPLTILHILVEYPLHGEGWLAFHLNGTLSDMLDYNCCSISNIFTCLTF